MEDNSSTVLKNLDTYLQSQSISDNNSNPAMTPSELLSALEATRDVQQYFVAYTASGNGLLGKLKAQLAKVISNVVLSMLAEPLAKQQKFNNLVYQYLQELTKQDSGK